ncbi:MAG: hypothetical protein EA376_00485 [Phycisphaeraceae bacterium]|nr:MAG: hypothetical protein EA376_00485 [Phycisphaeraceae bacterium]
MGDRPGHFDHTLPGAHPDALRLATGSAAVLPTQTLTHPLGVNALEFRQGFDASGAPGNPNNPGGAPSRWWVDQIHLEEVLGDPPPPPCPWDLTSSGTIGSGDVGWVLGCWGVVIAPACAPADFTNSGSVGSADLAQILGNWGPCP